MSITRILVLLPQELQRQVRLRLWQERGEEGKKEEGERERETVHHQYRRHSLQSTHTTITIVSGEEEQDALKERKRVEDKSGEETSGRQSTVQVISKRKHSSHCHGDKELYNYLRHHFTAPSDQLRQLTTTGRLKTHYHRIKRGGRGGGGGGGGGKGNNVVQSDGEEEVRWPVEAHISLPTPHHITPSLSTPHHIPPSLPTPHHILHSLPTPHDVTPTLPTAHHITPSNEKQCGENHTIYQYYKSLYLKVIIII